MEGQLQELHDLLQARTGHEEQGQRPSYVPSATSSCERLLEKRDSDSRLSNTFYDSLNSPCLPAKYLSQDILSDGQSPQGHPLHGATDDILLTNGLPPSLHSTPIESKGSLAGDTEMHHSSQRQANDMGYSRRQKKMKNSKPVNQDVRVSENEDKATALVEKLPGNVENSNTATGEGNGGISAVQERGLPSDDHDVSDVSFSDEELHLPAGEVSGSSNGESDNFLLAFDHSREGGDTNYIRSPDSRHLHEAKKNLKKAKQLVYGSGTSMERNSEDDRDEERCGRLNTQNLRVEDSQYHVSMKVSATPGQDNSKDVNCRSVGDRSTKSLPNLPHLLQSQYGPRTRTSSNGLSRKKTGDTSGTMCTTMDHSHMTKDPCHMTSGHNHMAEDPSDTIQGHSHMTDDPNHNVMIENHHQGHMTKDQSHMTDSGFAGSEFPSRTATRMDTTGTERDGTLTTSMLQLSADEDDINQQRLLEAT